MQSASSFFISTQTMRSATNSGKKRTASAASSKACASASLLTIDCTPDDGTDPDPADGGGGRGSSHQFSARDVKSKVSDFARFVDSFATDTEKTKKQLAIVQIQLVQMTELNTASREEHERSAEGLRQIITDQETSIQDLREENADLHLKVGNIAGDNAELLNLRSVVASAKSQLKDYITLETTGVSLITTTGQVGFAYWLTNCARFHSILLIFDLQR